MSRTVAAAFPERRDWLMLAVLSALIVGFLHGDPVRALFGDWRSVTAAGALSGWIAARALRNRLDWHRGEGVLAVEALARGPAARFLAAGLRAAGLLIAAIGVVVRPESLPFLLMGCAAGAVAGLIVPALSAFPRLPLFDFMHAGRTPLQVVASTQLPFGWSRSSGGMLAAAALVVGVASAFAGRWAPLVAAAGTALSLLRFARVDASTARFLAIAGVGAVRSAALHLAVGGAYLLLAAAIGAWLGWGVTVAILAVGAAFAFFTVLRVWAYRALPRRTADATLTTILLSTGVAGVLLPPLLVPLLVWFGWSMRRRAAAATWSLP